MAYEFVVNWYYRPVWGGVFWPSMDFWEESEKIELTFSGNASEVI